MITIDKDQLSQISGGQDPEAARKLLDAQLRQANHAGGLGAFSKPSDLQLDFLKFINPDVARDMIKRFQDANP